jgi:hypothetical protein
MASLKCPFDVFHAIFTHYGLNNIYKLSLFLLQLEVAVISLYLLL